MATLRKALQLRPPAWGLACAIALLALSAAGPTGAVAGEPSADRGQSSTRSGKARGEHQARTRARARRLRRAKRLRRAAATRRRTMRSSGRTSVSGNVPLDAANPATPASDVLDAGFEQGLANWNTAGVGDVVPTVVSDVVRSGSRSSEVTLTGSQGRSELILGGNGGGSTEGMVEFYEGDEYWYGFSFYIESMVYGRPGAHNVIMQFKSDGTGSPNFDLSLWDYQGDKGLWSEGDAMGGNRFLAPTSEHQWHDVAIHFKASRNDTGFYEVYLDGGLVDARGGVSMIRPDRTYAYIKNGIYRNGGEIPGTSEIRIDAARLGRSAADLLTG